MGKTKSASAKNRKTKITFCYISLVFLVVLLFLPFILRLTVKDKKEVKQDIVTILNCQKSRESINSTFLNLEPQNILYKIEGDYTLADITDEVVDDSIDVGDNIAQNNNQIVTNELIEAIREHSTVSYSEATDLTSFQMDVTVIKDTKDYELIFGTIDNQEIYYQSLGFSCTKETL